MRSTDSDASYVAFVGARQEHLRRVAYAICGDWHLADDLLQIALTKLYVAWPRLVKQGREEAYCRRIIVRANVDVHRRPSRRERAGLDGIDASAPPDQADDRTTLFAALQELPEMQRKVVVLLHWLALSVEETAAELGISAGTVKSHTARGLERLRGVLAAAT